MASFDVQSFDINSFSDLSFFFGVVQQQEPDYVSTSYAPAKKPLIIPDLISRDDEEIIAIVLAGIKNGLIR